MARRRSLTSSVTSNFPLSPACSPTWALGSDGSSICHYAVQVFPTQNVPQESGAGIGALGAAPATLPGLRRRGFRAGVGRGQPGCWAAPRDSMVAAARHPLSPGERSPFCLCWSPAHRARPPSGRPPASEQCLCLSSDFSESYCERLQCLIPWGRRDLRESRGK